MMIKNIQENKNPIFAPRGGKPGYIVNGKWYPVDKQDLDNPQLKTELERYARTRGKTQLEKDQASLSKPKPKPDPKPAKPAQPAPTPTPAPQPSQTPPRREPPAGKPTQPATPAPAPAAPKPSPVADYMKAAAAARKSGDPAEMAKVRDMGMEIWAKKYKTTLAPKVQPGQSGYETIQKVVNPPAPAQTSTTPTPQVTPSKDTEMNKTAAELSKNPLPKKETKKEAYDIVLDYLLSEGHAETLSEAHYVMMQMDAEHIQNIVIQERAWWDPAGLFMSKREKEVEKAKSTPTGARGSYNPDTGRTYNPTAKDQARATGVIAPKGGIIGTMEPGKPSTWQRYAPGSDAFRRQNIDRYVTVRGREQIQLDDLKNRAMADKAKRDAAATAAFDKKYGVNEPPGDEFAGARKNTRVVAQPKPTAAPRTTSRPAATAPAAPKPKPQPPTIQSKNVTSTGVSYERRTPTSAELAAARAAGGGEVGIKAAVDVAKTNKVAATSPTPDLKPEAPKETPKRESLAAQVKELQAMRKAAEERNK